MNEYFKQLQQQFFEYRKAKGFSSNETKPKQCCMKIFWQYLDKENITDIKALKKEHLFNFATYLTTYKNSSISSSYQLNILCLVKSFCKYLLERDIIASDPSVLVPLPKIGQKLPSNILTVKQMNKLLLSPDINTYIGIRDRAIMELLYTTAIRNSELRHLKLTDLNLRDGEVFIYQGKGGKDRFVPVGKIAKEFLEIYLDKARPVLCKQVDNPYVFLSFRGKKLGNNSLQDLTQRYGKKAGLTGVCPHTFRHTCATHLLKNKAPIRYIQKLLGHASISSTQIYTHVAIEDLKEVVRKCHPREK